tara:strand:- start:1685 stop:3661 length:1977 start_codon:yes stop_codon:yes gene_type:complete
MAPAMIKPVRGRMFAAALACLSLWPALAAADLSGALDAMRARDWETARRLAGPVGSVDRDIVEWHFLRNGGGTAGEVMAFLGRSGDWPGLDWLRKQSEEAFATAPNEQVRDFFAGDTAQTPEGVLIQARALTDSGDVGEAKANIVIAWRTMAMEDETQAEYLSDYRDLLAPHHEARLSQMLWQGHDVSARRMFPYVSDGARKLAEARLGLYAGAGNVDTLIAAVPAPYDADPGLAHARFEWRAKRGRKDDAIELMLSRSTDAASLGEPAAWAPRRRAYARDAMEDGHATQAYRIAASHHLTQADGYAYSDLEWMAGYTALRFLKDPTRAATHFERFDASVETPISKGRGGYWLGRAYEAASMPDEAERAYASGADYQTSYYGLLAAEKLELPFDEALANPPDLPPLSEASFVDSRVFEAGQNLLDAGEEILAERFLTHLVEGLDPVAAAQLGAWAVDQNEAHLAVMISKRAAQAGLELAGAYYPLHEVGRMDLAMHPEMVLAIARRESEFDPSVISGAGARGLMQVMPATAQSVASTLELSDEHSTDRLLTDWRHNARLGAEYLARLAEQFDGNPVLMSAGYNAGPSRPVRWMREMGDPRRDDVDIVDWIEFIPFSETRNYVMRVTESLPVYRARLGLDPLPVPFTQELKGNLLRVDR